VQGVHVPYVDKHIFADELATYGPEVRVVEPADLRDAVIERLRAIVAAHAGGGTAS
jgi:proteasome accessory factor B